MLSKRLIEKTLDESVTYFKKEFLNFNTKVRIVYTTTDEWIESLIHSPMVKMQLENKLYENLEEEFPSFVYVTKSDIGGMFAEVFDIPLTINICYDIAKKRLRGFTEKEVTSYFQHIFVHELVHLKEDKLIEKFPSLWNQSLEITKHHPVLAKEYFAESFETILPNMKHVDRINKRLYRDFIIKAEKLKNKDGII